MLKYSIMFLNSKAVYSCMLPLSWGILILTLELWTWTTILLVAITKKLFVAINFSMSMVIVLLACCEQALPRAPRRAC